LDGFCDQTCINHGNGTAECKCSEGYYLEEGSFSKCTAINVPIEEPPTLIFSDSFHIERTDLDGEEVPGDTSITINDSLALDFNHRNKSACWIDHESNKASLVCAPIYNINNYYVISFNKLFSFANVNQIAYDWISGNWYFLNDIHSSIFLCNGTVQVCITLIEAKLNKPRGIAIDATKGLMFFTQWGKTVSLLEKARLDGTNRTALVKRKIVYPYGVTVDYPNEHVYWVDTYLDYIERINYDGTNRMTILSGVPVGNPYGITLFERYLYVTSWRNGLVFKVNKFNKTDIKTLRTNLTRPFSIHIYHRQRQPQVNHPCSIGNGGCEHICITSYKRSKPVAQCKCVAGFRSSRGQCLPIKKDLFLLYARGEPGTIKGISIEKSWKQEETIIPITNISRPTALDYDVKTGSIYFSDAQRYTIERKNFDGSDREVFINKGLNNCEGLAIDWMSRNIYWTDEGLLSIFVAKLSNSSIKTRLIYGNMSHPRSIVVDPKRG